MSSWLPEERQHPTIKIFNNHSRKFLGKMDRTNKITIKQYNFAAPLKYRGDPSNNEVTEERVGGLEISGMV